MQDYMERLADEYYSTEEEPEEPYEECEMDDDSADQ